MAGALVYPTNPKQIIGDFMKAVFDIPFEDAPEELILQLNSCGYTYAEYLNICPLYNADPFYWNCAIMMDNEDIVAFMWGMAEPLEKYLHITRVSMLKHTRHNETRMLMIDAIEKIQARYECKWVFFISDYADMFVGRSNGRFRISQGKVVEVVNYENLH